MHLLVRTVGGVMVVGGAAVRTVYSSVVFPSKEDLLTYLFGKNKQRKIKSEKNQEKQSSFPCTFS